MAHVYIDSTAGGAGTGADWANAYTTLAAAFTGSAAGDQFWVAENHAETQTANMTLTCPGTLASPCTIVCVNSAGTVPPVSADLATTATITTTTTGTITITGQGYFYGITISAGSGGASVEFILGGATQTALYFKNCALRTGGTVGGQLTIGSGSAGIATVTEWDNTTYQVANAGSGIRLVNGGFLHWKNTASAVTGATIPTNLFIASTVGSGRALIEGVDLDAMSTKTLVAAQSRNSDYYFKDCKLPASITINAAPTSGATVNVIRSASGATAYNLEKHDRYGDQTIETTVVRTGGAEVNGTGVALKAIGTSSATFLAPFALTPLVIGNTTTGANVTVTVYGTWSGGALPKNDDVWMEVGYLGSAATPILTFNSNAKADLLAADADQTTDAGSTWGGGTTDFKLVATLSSPQPAMAGEMYIQVKIATTNTVYIDPKVVLS